MSLPDIKFTWTGGTGDGRFQHLMAVAEFSPNAPDEQPGDLSEFARLVKDEILSSKPKMYGWRVEPSRQSVRDWETGDMRVVYVARVFRSIEKAPEGWAPDVVNQYRLKKEAQYGESAGEAIMRRNAELSGHGLPEDA